MGEGGGGLKLFISYRREDSAGIVGRIRDRLAREFGATNVFFDVDTIPFGVDFRAHIEKTIATCDAALVVIGPRWLTAVDDQRRRRLDNVGDFVRLEVEAALARDIPVVPLLVDGATIPKASQIPASMADLTNRNGIPVRHDPDFHTDLDRLIRGLEQPATGAPDKPLRASTTPARKASTTPARKASTAPARKAPPKRDPEKPVDGDPPVAGPAQRKADVPVSRQSVVRADTPAIDAVLARQSQSVGWFARQKAAVAYDRAVARERKGDLDAAIVYATKAIEADPKHATAFWFRGGVRKKQGNIDGAITDYTEAFRLDPRYALALYDRGRLREEQGDLAGAADDYARCLELAPDNAEFKQAMQRLRRS